MSLTFFWIAAGVMALGVAGLLLGALLRPRGGAEPAAAYDLRVYRDQLKEIGKDAARGLIGSADAERARTEIARRVLEADRALKAGIDTRATPRAARIGAGVLVVAVVLGGSALLYHEIGVPGYGDLPLAQRIANAEILRATRPDQAEAEADFAASGHGRPHMAEAPNEHHAALMEQLREAMVQNPNDLHGQELLARNEALLGNYTAAYAAQHMVIALKGPVASGEDYAYLADLMILATGGYVSPEAESALAEALRRDPENGIARYYSGLMFSQIGRPDQAFAFWRQLLATSPPNAPWVPPIRAQIRDIALLAGEHRYELPPLAAPMAMPPIAPGGPSVEDMEAAADMSPEARDEMVRGMVVQLNARLADEGGTAEDWARLIRAYGVLGDAEAVRMISEEAMQVFSGREADLDLIRAAAGDAGFVQ